MRRDGFLFRISRFYLPTDFLVEMYACLDERLEDEIEDGMEV